MAQRFMDIYVPDRAIDNYGNSDRELALFTEWAVNTNNTMFLNGLIDKFNLRYLNEWLPQTKINADGDSPVFGICAFDSSYFLPSSDNPSYSFRGGLNSQYIATAFAAITIYGITKNLTFLNLAVAHLDFLAGKNPFGICMFEGLGSKNLPCYHHLYGFEFNNPRGATPGAIGNGISKNVEYHLNGQSVYVDLPAFDLREVSYYHNNAGVFSSEPWLVHNVNAMYMITELIRVCA
jgi:hypothetical protein